MKNKEEFLKRFLEDRAATASFVNNVLLAPGPKAKAALRSRKPPRFIAIDPGEAKGNELVREMAFLYLSRQSPRGFVWESSAVTERLKDKDRVGEEGKVTVCLLPTTATGPEAEQAEWDIPWLDGPDSLRAIIAYEGFLVTAMKDPPSWTMPEWFDKDEDANNSPTGKFMAEQWGLGIAADIGRWLAVLQTCEFRARGRRTGWLMNDIC